MAEKANLLDSLLRTARESAFYNTNRLEKLQSKDYPYRTSHDFIRALLGINRGVLKKIDDLGQVVLSSEEEFKDQLVKVQRCGQILGNLHYLLQILEMGKREYVAQGMVDLLEDLIRVSGSNAKFLLLPSYDYNYAYVEITDPLKTSLRDVLPNIEELLGFAEKFVVFWFPLAHRDNTLLNALLSHEIGHFLSQENGIVAKIMSNVSVDKEKIQEIAQKWLHTKLAAEKKAIKIDDYFGLETAKTQALKEVVLKASEQLEELVADCIAFHLFGPVYMIALGNFLATLTDMDLEPKGYPSSRMRMHFLIDDYKKAKYPQLIGTVADKKGQLLQKAASEFGKLVEAWWEFIRKGKIAPTDNISKLVAEVIDDSKPVLRKEVSNIVGKYEYRPERFQKEVFMLIQILDSFVPPTEIGFEQPADPISILNAGALYELTLLENMHNALENKTPEEQLETIHKLHKLVMKAIEGAQTQKLLKEN